MSTEPIDPEDAYDPEVSEGEAPQMMRLFNDETEEDVHLDPKLAAFDRVQDDRAVDDAYDNEANRRYVKDHGDHRDPEATGPETETPPA